MSAKESFLYKDKKYRLFLALLKAGLWDETNANLSFDNDVDWNEIYRLAEEQSVIGLIAEGIETVQGEWLRVHGSPFVPQTVALQFVGQTLQIEQRNKTMNAFLAQLVKQLRKEDVYALLVKGQGVAQCYKKPCWRIYNN